MRKRFRKFVPIVLLLMSGPAVLLVFSQLGMDLSPLRGVKDRYPVFTDVAVDPDKNLLAITDENLFSLRTYDRDISSNEVADPRTVITGNKTGVDFVCGVAIDPTKEEIFSINNDTAADMMVFKYDGNGNVARRRSLKAASATTWGVSLDLVHDEVAVTIEQYNKVAVFRREAEGDEKPLRIILGPNTGLSDPHGYSSILRTTKSSSPTMIHTMSLPPMTIPRRRQPRNSLAASRLQPSRRTAMTLARRTESLSNHPLRCIHEPRRTMRLRRE